MTFFSSINNDVSTVVWQNVVMKETGATEEQVTLVVLNCLPDLCECYTI